jgi:EmrB/QacA subfamily drug resistance transporter
VVEGERSLSRRETVLLVTSLILAIALAALDALVVGTAMPTIVGSLGGISLYSWLVSIYLLTSTTTVPLYGRLADIYGRKPVFLFGISLFLVGSVLCGLAGSMVQLIIFRAVQGLGAGAVLPLAMTIIGDVFSVEERARMQGMFSAVWGVSSVIGPPLGALIVTYLSWHWIFFVNIPVGLFALALIVVVYHERVERHERRLDLPSLALLIFGATVLLFALQEIGHSSAERAAPLPLLFGLALGMLGLFFWLESRSEDPLVPVSFYRRPIIGIGYLVGFLSGMAQLGFGTYVPLFVQGAMLGTVGSVGLVMAPLSIAWPIGSTASGRLILRSGYRSILVAGVLALAVGTAALLLLNVDSPLPVLMAIAALVGLGMGLSTTPRIIALQNAVAWNQRGMATALNQFSMTMGGAVGVALMGAIFNGTLTANLARAPETAAGNPGDLANALLDPVARVTLGEPAIAALRLAFADSLLATYVVAAVAAALALVAAIAFFPRGGVSDHVVETSDTQSLDSASAERTTSGR